MNPYSSAPQPAHQRGPLGEMFIAQQTARSEKEKQLPSYAWSELDMARSGYDLYGKAISLEQRVAVFSRWGLILGK